MTPSRSGSRAAARVALASGLTLVSLAACGSPGTTTDEAQPLGPELAGSVAPLAQCSDWNKGNEAEKLATIDDIRGQVNRQSGTVQAPPLSDDEAMQVFDNACANDFAESFRLYVLYARAAGFAPLTREP